MKCCKAISKKKLGIIAGAVVLLITLLAVFLVVMFEIRKSPDNKEGRYIIFYMWKWSTYNNSAST